MNQEADISQVSGRPVQFTVSEQDSGRQLVRVVLHRYPQLRPAVLYQALRKRDVKVNGRRIRSDRSVKTGDMILVYLPSTEKTTINTASDYSVVRQSGPVWIIKKMPGISVQAGSTGKPQGLTLLEKAQRELDPDLLLCHRLDRQTGGLLLLAAGQDICQAVRQQMQQGFVIKRYSCLVQGIPDKGQPARATDGLEWLEMSAWLEKQASSAQVYIHQKKQPGDQPITTRYRVVRIFPAAGPGDEAISELLVELVSGRTHQIRAHLAAIGHPLLGDGKYGRNDYNRHFLTRQGRLRHQELWATILIFDQRCRGPLAELAGETIQIRPAFTWAGYTDARQDRQDI